MNNNQSNGHINLKAGYFKHLWLLLPSWINITMSFWSQSNYTVVNFNLLSSFTLSYIVKYSAVNLTTDWLFYTSEHNGEQ